ncbi:MAG TPA: ammonium transporter [Pirellulaceae bacterium]|nr:ammonium transporter [Pirellulaceae bacterium]
MIWSKFPSLPVWLFAAAIGLSLVGISYATAQEAAVPETSAEAAATEEAAAVEATEAATTEPAAEAPAEAGLSFEDETTYTINTLIMFLCAVLVLFMQAGFAMLEVGLNAAKNTVNILFKNVMDLSIGVLLFLFIGYHLMYPGADFAGKWFGHSGSWLVGRDIDAPNMETGWSNSADFLFQVAFAATAATIVSGAVAGRMKFGAYLVYSAVLTGLIYPVSGMWKWGGGALAEWGFADFAGSVVVHAVGGFAGLAGAIALGARLGRFSKDGKSIPMPGHNIAFAALGVFVLWVGWYGFNPGSQLTYAGAANAEATSYIALTTTIAAAAGAMVAMIVAWSLFKKPDVTMALNGVLAGLVGITANCDQVTQVGALVIGGVAGALVVAGIVLLDKLKIDDPVGAFPVHGMCGVWGGIATGLLGTSLPVIEGVELTRLQYIQVQVTSTAIICAWAFVTMLCLFYALKAIGFLRVSPEHEQAGLDVSEHGMHAYPAHLVTDSYSSAPGSRSLTGTPSA